MSRHYFRRAKLYKKATRVILTVIKFLQDLSCLQIQLFPSLLLRPNFTSLLVHGLAFGKPKFYIAPYDKINHRLVNLSNNCYVKSDLRVKPL